MNLVLSWDLFVVVMFVMIVAYSFIIGLDRTLKTLIGTYLAILAADGLGNVTFLLMQQESKLTKLLKLYEVGGAESHVVIKIILFIAIVVILSIRGAYQVNSEGFGFPAVNTLMSGVFGFLNAGLIVSTLLVYVSGISLIGAKASDSNIVDIYSSSQLVQYMVDYYNLWFSIPVVALVVWSLFFKREEE